MHNADVRRKASTYKKRSDAGPPLLRSLQQAAALPLRELATREARARAGAARRRDLSPFARVVRVEHWVVGERSLKPSDCSFESIEAPRTGRPINGGWPDGHAWPDAGEPADEDDDVTLTPQRDMATDRVRG